MADGAKNVGQVAGIWIGNVAPENTNIIWFDINTSERRHKVYDFGQMKWVTLNPQIVVPTTYNELVNTARQSGLSVGSMYKLTDMSNVLAYAITTTKVQYNDNKGNIIVDDLGTGKEYHVSSSNLLIDGVRGVFDTATNQLIFSFIEDSVDEDVYLFGKKKVNNVWRLIKAKISALISKQEGNSITWKNGLFFSFNAAISSILNKRGGVVGKTAYDKDMEEIAVDIENVGKENQRILKSAKDYTDENVTDDAIFSKKITDDIADDQPVDVHKNMTLKDIVANFQRWLTRLRWATGVKLTRSFTQSRTFQWINNNDTVESAFGKVQYILHNFTDTLTIPKDFVHNDNVTNEQDIKDEKFRNATLRTTFALIIGFISNLSRNAHIGDDIRNAINNSSSSNEDKLIEDLKAKDQYGINVSIGKAFELIIKYIANSENNVHVWLSDLNRKRNLDESGLIQETECDREDMADSIKEFFRNIIEFLLNAANNVHLNDEFEIKDDIENQSDAAPEIGDSINNALSKLGGWFNDLTKHIIFDTWEYSKVTFTYSEQEIVDLKDKSLYAVVQLVASYLEDTWANAHMNKETLPLPTVTDETDLINQINHKTGADNMGVNIYEAIGVITAFIKNNMNTHHLPSDFEIDQWDQIKDFSITSNESWQGKSLGYVLKKLIGIVSYGSKLIDISLSEDWVAETGEDLTQESIGQMQSFKMDAAFARIAGIILAWHEKLILPEEFGPSPSTEINSEAFTSNEALKSLGTVIADILGYIARNTTNAHLPSGWQPKQISSNIALPASGDNIDDTIAKIVGKLEQIGDISNGMIQSKATAYSGTQRATVFDLAGSYLEFHASAYNKGYYSGYRMELDDTNNGNSVDIRPGRIEMKNSHPNYLTKWWGGMTGMCEAMAAFESSHNNEGFPSAAILGLNTGSAETNYGGMFSSIKIGGLVISNYNIGPGETITLSKYDSCVTTYGGGADINITLPAGQSSGRTIYICQGGSSKITIWANGNDQIDRRGSSARSIDKNARGYMFTFVYAYGVQYDNNPCDGLWFVTSNDAE